MSDNNTWSSVSRAIEFIKRKVFKSKAPCYNEIEEALLYCAENEDAVAQYQMYAVEYNRNKSNADAYLKWCKKAAHNGYAMAQYDLGLHYWYGEGIEQNYFLALSWIEKAADQDHYDSQQKLVSIYSSGRKLKEIPERAEYWRKRVSGIKKDEIATIIDLNDWMIEYPIIKEKEKRPLDDEAIGTLPSNFKRVDQEYVIKADVNKSFVVNAGPGTGKTYTLINRINELVNQGLDESEIIVLSFTNAVVEEVGERLVKTANDLQGDRLLRQIKDSSVKTFHSFAYWLLKEANKDTDLKCWEQIDLSFNRMNYNDCLLYGAKLLEEYKDIAAGWRYVIIDEIQDINMEKALFVLNLLDACIEYECSFLLLGDSCQSIYEYVSEKNTAGYSMNSSEFYSSILDKTKKIAEFVSFNKNFRSVSELQKFTIPVRNQILNEDSMEFRLAVDNLRQQHTIIESSDLKDIISKRNNQSICIMERSNFLTKMRSIALLKEGISHRCVLTNCKKNHQQWIGQMFSEYISPTINYDQFKELLNKVNEKPKDQAIDAWWNTLKESCDTYSNVLNMRDVIKCIAYRNLKLYSEENKENVVVSNIHRSKGLEYDCVILNDTFAKRAHKKLDEMRTLYVAITRPKEEMFFLKHRQNDRIFHSYRDGREYVYGNSEAGEVLKYVEIRYNEESADYFSKDFYLSDENVMKKAQQRINSLKENSKVYLCYDEKVDRYAIVLEKGNLDTILGWMSKAFSYDIRYFHKETKMPVGFEDIYIDGVFTHITTNEADTVMLNLKLQESFNIYAKTKVWNYVQFSGPCRAIYED